MRKRHKKVRNGVVALTLLVVTGLFFGGQKIKALTKEVEYKEMVPANSKKYTKTAVAYANCAGGLLIIWCGK